MKKSKSNFDNLTLSNDFLFKKVMQQKHICKHILEEILHTKIADITYLQAEETVDVYPDSHGIRLDVKVADTIVDIKNDKKVRKEYMTYEMRMKDLRNEAFYNGKAEGKTEGRIEGKFEATFNNLKSLMKNNNCSIDAAMDLLSTPLQERQHYKDLLAKDM